jgi:hypothetical protein
VNIRIAVQTRSSQNRWVYILCGILVGTLAVPSVAMEGSIVAVLPYLALIFACVVQFLRPTLLVWAILMLAFVVYTVAVVAHFRQLTTDDLVVFLPVGLIPTMALLWAWPRAALPK